MNRINRRTFLKAIGAVGCTAALAGCGAASSTTASAAATTAPASEAAPASAAADTAGSISGAVTTGGSTSMEKVMSALTEGFAEVQPGIQVSYDPTGSGAGVTGAVEGSLDIGLASRGLHDDETGVTATTVALDGIAMVVSTTNAVADLTVEQIASIFTGEVTNWKDVGGADATIVVIGREAGSGTRDGFESICGVSDTCVYAQELTATGAVISAVASNENAIGYASLSALDDSVKALTVGGVECTEATVLDGSYAIQRPFNFVTNEANPLSEAAQAFMDFALSEDASSLISGAGAVPMK